MLVVFGVTAVFMVYNDAPFDALIVVNGTFLLILAFYLYLNYSTAYSITNDRLLHVRCGFIYNKWYDINKIRSVKNSDNLFSSPAPSLDRLELVYGQYGLIVISPKDKQGFTKALIEMNPEIENKLNS